MGRNKTHTIPTQATMYEQRQTKDASHSDESKRRRMIRWIRKTMGMSEQPTRELHYHPHPHHHYGGGAHPPPPVPHPSSHARHHSGYNSGHHSSGIVTVDLNDEFQHLQLRDPYGHQYEERSSLSRSGERQLARKYSHSSNGSAGGSGREVSSSSVFTTTAYPHSSQPYYPPSVSEQCHTSSGSGYSTASSSASSIFEFSHQMPLVHQIQQARHSNPHQPAPHVLIVGGGIGGLCLAQGLKKHGIPFTVFERDPAPNYRTQGYRLRINSSGYEALKANLSRESFEVFLRSTGHFLPGFMYVDAHSGGAAPANVKFPHKSSITQHVFSSDRAMLRSLLLMDLVEGHEIHFGLSFKRYQTLPNGRVEVHFDNGRVAEGSVLVGADGTTSRVRRQYLPRHITLLDTDSGAIYGKTPITPDIENYFATGSTTMVTSQAPRMTLVIEPRCATKMDLQDYMAATGGLHNAANTELPDLHRYLCWVLIARAEHFHVRDDMTVQDLYAMTPDEVAELSKQITGAWCPRVRAIFEQQAPEWCSFMRISSMSPDMKPWQPTQVTLLGDAAHTMAPAGIGCNTAMQDARILVQCFREYGVNVDAIAEYERAMREHGREGIDISIEAGKRMYDLPEVEAMRSVVY
ncbi:hypothetical protein P43SY_008505 [Pythium insidiosum]|uniref:FAD-binding domain-containing protein n=1 Tax=Pythium insidiosum TaxID=114742 RepID=A0AAD5LQW5_PYTIN|nr:hypothetical protein P43SY_008505 [Pythium insidiosum]